MIHHERYENYDRRGQRILGIARPAACLLPVAVACAAGLALLSSCSSDPGTLVAGCEEAGIPVSVAVSMEQGDTRAATDIQSSTKFDQGEAFYAYFAGSKTTIDHTVYHTTDADNTVKPQAQPFLKQGVTDAVMYAYYPVFVNNTTSSFSVQLDQSVDANYKQSDLMYAQGAIDASTGQVALSFAHRMAKIIVEAASSVSLKIQEIHLIGGKRTIAISSPLTCGLNTASANALSDLVTAMPAERVTMYKGGTATSATAAALLPPQTIDGNLLLIKTDKGTITYKVSNLIMASNGVYKFTLNVTDVGITVTITDWDNSAQSVSESHALTFNVGSVLFRMVAVEGGSAQFSSTCSQTIEAEAVTTPRTYTVNETVADFYLAESEVTNQLWNVCNNAAAGTSITPKTTVSLTSINTFLTNLNTKTEAHRPAGWIFALPTLAQWLWAASGGRYSHGFTCSGSNTVDDVAWHLGNSGGTGGTLKNVMTKAPNELGLYDMSGNVFELVNTVSQISGKGNIGVGGSYKVQSYFAYLATCVSDIHTAVQAESYSDWGFRIALVPE